MEVKLIELVESRDALTKLASQEVKAFGAYVLAKALRVTEPHVRDYNAVRLNLVEKYGTERKNDRGEGTGVFNVPPEHRVAVAQQLDEMGAAPVQLSLTKVKASKMVEQGVKFSGETAAALDWLIEDDLSAELFEKEPSP